MDEHHVEHAEKDGGWRKFLPHFAFLALICLGVGALAGTALNPSKPTPTLQPTAFPAQNGVNEEELKTAVEDYINGVLLAGSGAEGVVSSVKKGENAYEMALNIVQDGSVVDSVIVYASLDGSTLYTAAFDLTEPLPSPTPSADPLADLEKTETPVADVFVMSYCPYGTQFEKALLPVVELLGDKADFHVKFVSYAMHGETEIMENTRQYCIERDYGNDELFDYLACFLEDGNYSRCIAGLDLDGEAIDSCIGETHEQLNVSFEVPAGYSYPLYPVYAEENAEYGVGGSPTFVLNGEVLSVSRSPEAIKEAVCAAFLEPPEECSQTLSSEGASPGFGYEGGSTATGSCA